MVLTHVPLYDTHAPPQTQHTLYTTHIYTCTLLTHVSLVKLYFINLSISNKHEFPYMPNCPCIIPNFVIIYIILALLEALHPKTLGLSSLGTYNGLVSLSTLEYFKLLLFKLQVIYTRKSEAKIDQRYWVRKCVPT